MRCPGCKDEMIILEYNEVEIDFCHRCGGIWLDVGELELLVGEPEQGRELLAQLKEVEKDGPKRKCPICSKKMKQVELKTAADRVVLDECRKLHGVWFDKGELERVIKAGTGADGRIGEFLKQVFGKKEL